MQPLLYIISLHRWQLFVTLTFKSREEFESVRVAKDGTETRKTWSRPVKVPGVHERRKMLFAFLRESAKGLKRDRSGQRVDSVPFHALHWVAREETGELNGRYHFHLLLSGLPPSRCNTVERFAQKSIWQGVGGGFADVRAFDAQLAGAAYVLKGLEQWSRSQANAYEVGKFKEEEGRALIVSNALCDKWRKEFADRTRAKTAGTRSAVITGVSPVGSREAALRRAKEVTEAELRKSYGLNWHPAGISLVK